jgi:hypothetical protein
VALLFGACATTSPSDKASKQAEVGQATHKSLDKFYKADPKLQSAVANAPGYAVFTTYGLSFIVGGAGGGVIAQAGAEGKSVGPGVGENVIADAKYYTLTPNGLQAGVAGAGTKYWKSTSLN